MVQIMTTVGFIVLLVYLNFSSFTLADAFLISELIQRDSGGFSHYESHLKRHSANGDVNMRMLNRFKSPLLEPRPSTIIDTKTAIIAAASTAVSSSSSTIADLIAKGLGYVMGLGAVAVYLPIVIKLLRSKSSDGLSLQTWIFNLLGLSLSVYYPFKKGFPISTYIELVTVAVQTFFILFLVCFYRDLTSQYFLGIAGFAVLATALSVATVPAPMLNAIQFVSIILCNYANVPQILLTFRLRKASWSGATALMSLSGCLIRMFTTVQLTKDLLVFGGYSLGFLTNLILFLQVLYFKDK